MKIYLEMNLKRALYFFIYKKSLEISRYLHVSYYILVGHKFKYKFSCKVQMATRLIFKRSENEIDIIEN